MNNPSRFWLLPILSILTACGGGGGKNDITLTSPNYTGKSETITVNIENANVMSNHFLSLANTSRALTTSESASVQAVTKRVLKQIQQESSGNKSISALSNQQSCLDGGYQTTTTNFNKEGQGTLSIYFNACQENNLLYVGKISSKISKNSNSAYFAITFDLGVVNTTSSGHTHITGYTEVTDTFITNTEVIKRDLMVEDVSARKSVYLKNLTTTTVYNDINTRDIGTTTISGELYSNDLGRVEISTPTPIHTIGGGSEFQLFGEGAFLLKGANNTTTRITLDSAFAANIPMSAKIGVDANGDGTPEFEGYLANPNTKGNNQAVTAVITNVQPIRFLGSWIDLSGRDSEAANGKALSFNWEIVSKPVDSQLTLLRPSDAPEQFGVPDKIGTYIVELTVSDGTNTHKTQSTFVITAP